MLIDGSTGTKEFKLRGSSPFAKVSRQEIQKPANLRLGLPDLYTRDGARNDQTLNFRSPLEDCVDTGVTNNSPRQGLFSRRIGPGMSEKWVI